MHITSTVMKIMNKKATYSYLSYLQRRALHFLDILVEIGASILKNWTFHSIHKLDHFRVFQDN